MGESGDLRGDAALSPVIGVVVLVAITVGIAATAFRFVTTLGGEAAGDTQPNIRFEIEFTDFPDAPGDPNLEEDYLTITHAGGAAVEVGPGTETSLSPKELYVRSTVPFEDEGLPWNSGFECGPDNSNGEWYECPFNFDNDFAIAGSTMTAGETARIWTAEPEQDLADGKIQIVYESLDGETRYVLAEWTGPDYTGS